jgi:3',5'-cyclic-AMP phosphodiesterase
MSLGTKPPLPPRRVRKTVFLIALLAVAAVAFGTGHDVSSGEIRFAILGDRTGEAVPGVFEEAWRETNLDHPDFVVTVGDTIQGGDDLTMDTEWRQVLDILQPYRRYKIFFTPGNHDVWSLASAQAFEKYAKHPVHYSFDFKQAHFTILDNSRSDEMPAEELAFLQKDLELHRSQPVKFIFSHRPSWILQAVLGNPAFPLHQLAKRFGVQYVIAGHIHQMLHFELDGVTYLSMASSGGHLRESKSYERGWFFQHTLVTVRGNTAAFEIKELAPPYGKSRVTTPADWGAAGLVRQPTYTQN